MYELGIAGDALKTVSAGDARWLLTAKIEDAQEYFNDRMKKYEKLMLEYEDATWRTDKT